MDDHQLAEARAMAARNEPLPEAFYIDRYGEVQWKRTDSVVNYLRAAIEYAAIGDRRSAQLLVEYARNTLSNELGPLSVRLQLSADRLGRDPKLVAVVNNLPETFYEGLPEEDQIVIRAEVGKPMTVVGHDDRGWAELEFRSAADDIHTIWVDPALLKFLTLDELNELEYNHLAVDWNDCPLVQRTPGRLSGALAMVSSPRVPVEGLLANFNAGQTVEEVADIYLGTDVEDVRGIIRYWLHHTDPRRPIGERWYLPNGKLTRDETDSI